MDEVLERLLKAREAVQRMGLVFSVTGDDADKLLDALQEAREELSLVYTHWDSPQDVAEFLDKLRKDGLLIDTETIEALRDIVRTGKGLKLTYQEKLDMWLMMCEPEDAARFMKALDDLADWLKEKQE